MSDPDGYPPPDQPRQAGPPADQPPPGQTAQAGPPAARPPWQPPDPYQVGPLAGQPPPGPPYQAWPPPDPYQAGAPAAPLPPWTSAAPPPSWSPTAGQPTLWPPPPPAAGPRHRPLAGQTAALTVLLAAIAVADLAASVAASLSRIVWGSVEFGQLLLRLVVIPVFLVWFYRARKKADGRGQDQRWGPGWAIGAWVTPFVCLWFPYQIMADIWRANLPAERRASRAWLPGFWWGCWIAGDIIGGIALASTRAAASSVHTVTYVLINLSTAAAAILLIVIVRIITRGPVGREPVAAQPGLAPQDGMMGPGPVYPQVPTYDGAGHLAAGVGYALSALAVVIAAALTATAIYGQSITTGPVAAHTSAAAPAPAVHQVAPYQLRAGDCIQGPADINTSNTWPDLISLVPCTQKHLAEVFYSANYWPAAMAFPGKAVVQKQSDAKCRRAFSAYDGSLFSESQYSYYDGGPLGRQDWHSGDRQLVCVAYLYRHRSPRGKPLYASIRNSDQ